MIGEYMRPYRFSLSQARELHLKNLKEFAELTKNNQIDIQGNIFAQMVIGMMMVRSSGVFKESKEWEGALNACNGVKLFPPAVEMGRDFEILIHVMGITEQLNHKIRAGRQEPVDKFEETFDKLSEESQKLCFGLLKQFYDCASGIFQQLIKAGSPPHDTKAQEAILKDLERFQIGMKFESRKKYVKSVPYVSKKEQKYERASGGSIIVTRNREFLSDYYLQLMKALEDFMQHWEKNKYLGHMELIKGLMRRGVKEDVQKLYEKNIELATAPHLMETVQNLDEAHPLEKNLCEDNILWVEQVARKVGVSPETLRNWDKQGLFHCEKLKKNGKEYRIYMPEDIPKLIEIKEEQEKKRSFSQDEYLTLRELAKHVNVSPRTIMRKEDAGKLPQPKRNKQGYRIYTLAEAEKIKKLL